MEKNLLSDAYTFLARKKLTEHELIEKLLKKGHTLDEIEERLDELRELGYLNDREVIESEVRRAVLMGHGPMRVATRLAMRMGLDFYSAGELAKSSYPHDDQIGAAKKVLLKKKPPREKLFSTLSNRGFTEPVLQHFLSADINE